MTDERKIVDSEVFEVRAGGDLEPAECIDLNCHGDAAYLVIWKFSCAIHNRVGEEAMRLCFAHLLEMFAEHALGGICCDY